MACVSGIGVSHFARHRDIHFKVATISESTTVSPEVEVDAEVVTALHRLTNPYDSRVFVQLQLI